MTARSRQLARAGAVALVALIGLASVAGPAGAAASSTAAATATDPNARILVLSVPTLAWSDVTQKSMPNLYRLLSKGAVADLSTKGSRSTMRPAESYATIGAGARAVGATPSGNMFEPDEKYGADTAGRVYQRRTGIAPDGSIVAPEINNLIANNAALLFGAKVSALGDALTSAGVHRAVIANADEPEPSEVRDGTQYGREAVSALMDSRGILPRGDVGPGILQSDPNSPYGVRLNVDQVEAEFEARFTARSVVLVEASDLIRADDYRSSALDAHRPILSRRAVARTDVLIGRLLRHVNLRRDSVLVVGVSPSSRQNGNTVTGLVSPDVAPGLMTSATVRRAGFVQLIDVAPTILSMLRISIPSSMEGRPYERDSTGGSFAARRTFLIRSNQAGMFRDAVVRPASVFYGWAQVILALSAVATIAQLLIGFPRLLDGFRRALPWFALALLAFLPLTSLAVPLPFFAWGSTAYWAFIVAGSAVLVVVADGLLRRNRLDPLIAMLGLAYVVIVGDVVLNDARLQFTSVLGYSPTAAGRFAGLGNLGFAVLAAGTVLLAALLAHRIGGRRGRITAIVVCVVALVVDGAPMWGADVGGLLAGIPAYAVFITLLLGLRIRWRAVLAWGLATVAGVTALGFLDLARPAAGRTHLGRLFEKIGKQGSGGFSTVIHRKLTENLATWSTSTWRPMLFVSLLVLAWVVWKRPEVWRGVSREVPELRAALAGFATFAVFGYALNDSGIAIPALMLGVLNSTLVYLVWGRRRRELPDPMTEAREPVLEPG